MNLAIISGNPVFKTPRSTSNLVKPDQQVFLNYIKQVYSADSQLSGLNSLTEQLEERLAREHGSKYCIAMISGLWGIVMAMDALRLPGKNEVVMPSFTYRRMAHMAAWLDMIPHFCDVDYQTQGVRASDMLPCINENTGLLLAPQPIVNLCDIDSLIELSEKTGIPVLFDSVEASFAEHKGRKIGSFGNAECFSLHASKFLNGCEGAYVTTNDEKLDHKLRLIRNGGINDKTGALESFGMDGKIIEFHAGMALASLDDKDAQIERNKERFLKYKKELGGVAGITLLEYSMKEKRTFKNIIVKLEKEWPISRDLTIKILQAENMVVRPYYYPPLHIKEKGIKTIIGDLTNTMKLKDEFMLLPCGEFVSLEDIEIVVNYLKYISKNGKAIAKQIGN